MLGHAYIVNVMCARSRSCVSVCKTIHTIHQAQGPRIPPRVVKHAGLASIFVKEIYTATLLARIIYKKNSLNYQKDTKFTIIIVSFCILYWQFKFDSNSNVSLFDITVIVELN